MASSIAEQAARRRTFAIISHPDAGKTTLTEKLLLFGGAIQLAGTVKGRKASRHATSDWMTLEQQRGISITTSVMQFPYKDRIVNLLDTPGHEDFSEDTYRTLTAVDSALMVIDAAKGVEPRTIKLMEVCRMRDTPIVTFINKLDREGRPPLELLDEIERILNIRCTPVTWPVGMGRDFKGVYHLLEDRFYLYSGDKLKVSEIETIDGLHSPGLEQRFGYTYKTLLEEIELVRMAGDGFTLDQYRAAKLTPVFFGSGINNFGVRELLNSFVEWSPPPQPRNAGFKGQQYPIQPEHKKFTGFCFKIQANMDPKHRDRVAFVRICSGRYHKGMDLHSVRLDGPVRVSNALTFMAKDREVVDEAWPGDIIGLHNYGTIAIGDTFSEGEDLRYSGVPNFAPDLFRRVVLKDPLKSKQLNKGLDQLCEEGATQVYRPLANNDIILGAVGQLQFEVTQFRLKDEYGVEAALEPVTVHSARWIAGEEKKLKEFTDKNDGRLARDHFGDFVYLASSAVNLQMTQERFPDIRFTDTREHSAGQNVKQIEIHANGIRHAALEQGQGPLVLLLHGFPDNAHSWEYQMSALAKAGYRAVAVWLRGYPPTEIPAGGYYDRATLALDVKCLIEVLNDGKPAFLVAQDWGAAIAYGVLGAFPEMVKRAVLLAIPHPLQIRKSMRSIRHIVRAFHWWMFQLPRLPEVIVKARNYAFIEFLWKLWSPDYRDHQHVAHIKKMLAQPGALTAALGYYRAALQRGRQDPALVELRGKLDRPIVVPTLVLCGADDIRSEHLELQRGYFSGRYESAIVPGSGHFLHREKPGEVNRRILAWLKDSES